MKKSTIKNTHTMFGLSELSYPSCMSRKTVTFLWLVCGIFSLHWKSLWFEKRTSGRREKTRKSRIQIVELRLRESRANETERDRAFDVFLFLYFFIFIRDFDNWWNLKWSSWLIARWKRLWHRIESNQIEWRRMSKSGIKKSIAKRDYLLKL